MTALQLRRSRRLWLLAAVLLAGAGLAAALLLIQRDPPAPNVLLISLDTLRADRLGVYGYEAAQTPAIDALAARGVRFADAVSVGSLTLPAHSSLFTGTFPPTHGVRDNGAFYLDDDRITLAEILRERGYRTGGFVAAFVLDARWGIAQGFEDYFDDFDMTEATGPMDSIQRRGEEVVDRALDWLRRPSDQPFFAFVHLYDPHTPWEAPEPFRSRFPRTVSGSYDAEVAYTDFQVGRLLDALAADGLLDNTYVVLLADHGESLGQHDELTHGFFVYDTTLRIPLVIAGLDLPARVVPDQVRIVDVKPTILDLLRTAVPEVVQGRSLLPAVRGERLELLAFAETWYPRFHYGWSELMAVRDGRYKFIQAPRRELYDLRTDPGETENLADRYPAAAATLERRLRETLDGISGDAARQGPQRVDPEVEERLRALGYVGGTISARHLDDDRPRGDPKDKIGLYNLLLEAGRHSTDGRLDEALATVRRALAEDPEIIQAHTMVGNLHTKAGRHPEAIGAYRRALELDPEHPGATFSLAMAYKSAGLLEEAEVGFERAIGLDPRGGRAQFQLAEIWMQRGEFERAGAMLKETLELKTDRPPVLVKLAECYIEMGRHDEAERLLHEALAERPRAPYAHYDLGLIYEARGDRARARAAYEAELQQNPGNHNASFNLAKLLLEAGRPDEARKRFEEAVASHPGFGEAHLYLAKMLLDAGELGAAEQAARRGIAANPDPRVAPLGHYVLADVYSRLGREADAAREVAAARRLERGG